MRPLASRAVIALIPLAFGCDEQLQSAPEAAEDAEDVTTDTTDVGPDLSSDLGDVDPTETRADPDTASPDAVVDADAIPDVTPDADVEPPPPSQITVPLGETLFFEGDDYLARWGVGPADRIELIESPEGAESAIVAGRLTPDLAGDWVLELGDETLTVEVRSDTLNSDTFLNFNYTPNAPLLVHGEHIWAALPPANAVYRLARGEEGWAVDLQVPTGSWPVSLEYWDGGDRILVSQAGRDTIGLLDPNSGAIVDAYRVGNEPATVIVDGDVAYVVLAGEYAVVRVNLRTGEETGRASTGREPRAMVLDASGRLFIASLLSSNTHPQGRAGPEEIPDPDDVTIVDAETFEVLGSVPAVGTIIRGLFIDPDQPDVLVAAVSHSRNRGVEVDADSRPHAHGLAFVDIGLDSPTRYTVIDHLDLDRQESSTGPAASPFSFHIADETHLLLTLSAGNAVLVLERGTYEEVTRIPTGNDPRGLVELDDGFATLAWLDTRAEFFAWPEPEASAVVVLPGDPTPEDVAEGRRMFNDASFSRHGDFSCNNCHIDGLTDGMTWNLLLDGDVNTLSFRNVGGTGPFLWGGQLPTLFDFSREVLQLVGASATGHQMELLTTYMQSVTAPPNPHALPGGAFTEAALRGRDLFATTGCIACHSGPAFTNRSMVDGKTDGLRTDVPSLIATYDSGPWGRQGTWTTLEEMVRFAAHDYIGAELSDDELADLTQYVRELPGDRLYLNSARPLDGEQHVYFETEIQLVFSDSIAPEQDGLFSALVVGDTLEPLPGEWALSGRYARFTPDERMERDTAYRLHIAPGLRGELGSRTESAITIDFQTGAEPLTDVSGTFILSLSNPLVGTFDFPTSFLQSRGGKVTGVVSDDFEEGGIDHLEGSVSGITLVLDPFIVQSDFGDFPVPDGAEMDTVDFDDDGFADFAEGSIFLEALGSTFEIEATATRVGRPSTEP